VSFSYVNIKADAEVRKYAQTYVPPHNVEHFVTGKGVFPHVLIGKSETEKLNIYTEANNFQYLAATLGLFQKSSGCFIESVSHFSLFPVSFVALFLNLVTDRLEFVVVRNAGGRAEPALRDIVVLTCMAEITDLVVIHYVGA
jgi:hypothetical protein